MTLRLRFTLLTTGLVLALLLGTRAVVRGLEHARAERDIERATSDLLSERFPQGLRAPREPGARRDALPTPPLPDGADAVLLYAPLVRGAVWAHVLHTGVAPALPDLLSEPPPAVPASGPQVADVSRSGRRWRRRIEVVARRAPPAADEPAGVPRGAERPLRTPLPEDFGRYPPEGLEPRPGAPPQKLGLDVPPDDPFRPAQGAAPPPPPAAVLLGVLWYDRGPVERLRDQRLLTLDLVLLGALLTGSALSWLVAGLMLRPLKRAAVAAEAVETLSERLPERATTDELGRLVMVVNDMLGRLESAARRERTFLASASHELRRPLTALTGELELALRGPAEPGALRESVALALSDARAMGRLVGDLMDHARLDAGALTLQRADVPLAELVDEALARSQRALGTALDVHVEPLPRCVLFADRAALVRVLENLLENAGTHGGEGVRVGVRAEAGPTAVRVHVEDDGPGIPARDLVHLFEPFHRGDQARAHPGTGLGLSIARELARAHGGDVTALSPVADGRGTRMTLTLALQGGQTPERHE